MTTYRLADFEPFCCTPSCLVIVCIKPSVIISLSLEEFAGVMRFETSDYNAILHAVTNV